MELFIKQYTVPAPTDVIWSPNWTDVSTASEVDISVQPCTDTFELGGSLKRSARAVQLFGRLAVLETHTLRY